MLGNDFHSHSKNIKSYLCGAHSYKDKCKGSSFILANHQKTLLNTQQFAASFSPFFPQNVAHLAAYYMAVALADPFANFHQNRRTLQVSLFFLIWNWRRTGILRDLYSSFTKENSFSWFWGKKRILESQNGLGWTYTHTFQVTSCQSPEVPLWTQTKKFPYVKSSCFCKDKSSCFCFTSAFLWKEVNTYS